MQCRRCHHENSPDAFFCDQCGSRFESVCAGCGEANGDDARFCRRCGRILAGVEVASRSLTARLLSSGLLMSGERKQVTVLFADLKGSMELLIDRDPEEARRILDPVLERMIAAVHRYEGTVNQVMGDGIMALFGAPLAHEDHAVRACQAALGMQEAIGDYAEALFRQEALEIRIRVGLNSGEVVVRALGDDRHLDYSAVGDTTHLAARMEQLAQPGTTLMTAATQRFVDGLVEVEPLGPRSVKGIARPLDVYRLVGPGPVRSRLSARVAVRGLTRFVGRTDELERLERAREQTVLGRGQVVAVAGEPGVGKSRLFWEFIRSYCLPQHLVLEAGSASHGKVTPLLPVADLLAGYFAIERRDDPRHVEERIAGRLRALDQTLLALLIPLTTLFPGAGSDPDWLALDAPERRHRTLDACRRVLLRESEIQPLVLVFEDLHWIDSETRAFLDMLVESLPRARLLLLVNCRTEYGHAWSGHDYCSQLHLDPLPPSPAEELLDGLLGLDESLRPLKRVLIERTEGNPFFLEETVRALVETGALGGEAGARRPGAPISALGVPATVHAVLAARIDRLPVRDKELLQVASAIGKDVGFALLQTIADRSDEELRGGLARLQSAGFIHEERRAPDLEYTFRHALTHEVAYRSLLRSTKRRYHERIARSLIGEFPVIAENQPELVGHHLGETDAIDEALTWWERAGKRAAERSAHLGAIRYLRRALALLADLPASPERDVWELRMRVGMYGPLTATTGYSSDHVEELATRVRMLAQATSDVDLARRAIWSQYGFFVSRGPLQTALDLTEQLRLTLSADPPAWWTVSYHAAQVDIFFNIGEFRRAREGTERGFPHYDIELHNPRATQSLQDRGVALLSEGAVALAILGCGDLGDDMSRRALALARQVNHPYTLTWALHLRSVLLGNVGRPAGFGEVVEEMEAIGRRYGFALALARASSARAWGLMLEGRLEDSIPRSREALDGILATGARVGVTNALRRLADACCQVGRLAEARAALDGAFANMSEYGDHGYSSHLLRIRGDLILAETGNEAAAETWFRAALAAARKNGARLFELQAVNRLARLWQGRGRTQEAHALLSALYGLFSEGYDGLVLEEARAILKDLR
jgi:class 3 adenylate cyclase/tetratricopeptide (TPR) repeat protein